jgi:hypothetical protein
MTSITFIHVGTLDNHIYFVFDQDMTRVEVEMEVDILMDASEPGTQYKIMHIERVEV